MLVAYEGHVCGSGQHDSMIWCVLDMIRGSRSLCAYLDVFVLVIGMLWGNKSVYAVILCVLPCLV